MTKIALIGAGGRMGQRLVSCVHDDADCTLVGAAEAGGSAVLGQDAGRMAGLADLGVTVTDQLDDVLAAAEVAIDFSLTEATLNNIEQALSHNTALVIGTTGHSEEQKVPIRRLAERLPIVMAPNMSVGVNLMWKLLAEAATVLQDDYDVEIVEAHHRMKVDAPSGTAMHCAEVLATALGRDLSHNVVYHREGLTGPRKTGEIGIQTIRGGDIVGDHTVYFAGLGERLEITHRASSRDTFAKGAIRAAKWLVEEKPGFYDMQDVLGLK